MSSHRFPTLRSTKRRFVTENKLQMEPKDMPLPHQLPSECLINQDTRQTLFFFKRSTRQVAKMPLFALPCPPVRSNDTNRDPLEDFHEVRHSEGFNESYEHVVMLVEVRQKLIEVRQKKRTPAQVSCTHLDCNSQRIYLKGYLHTET